jgi:prepilin peptidase CpaA
MPLAFAAAVLTGLCAVVTDVRSRRIPNVLTFGSAAAALVFHAFGGHIFDAAAGLGLGLVLFLPVYLLRGLGAGDVKLLAAIGAWIGPGLALWTGLYTGVAGGVLAVAVALRHRYLTRALSNLWTLLTHWRVAGVRPVDGFTLETAKSPRLPYAIPILTGLVVALWLR